MSDERGVTSSQETDHVSSMQRNPASGKGTLDLWWFPSSAWRSDTVPRYALRVRVELGPR